jgi:hypothetical protein
VQKTLLSKSKCITVYILALVGAFEIATIVLPHLVGMEPSSPNGGELVAKTFPSPSGKYKAIVFTNTGGGAISPSCFQRVSVAPTEMKDSDVEREAKHEVYSGTCDSFANHDSAPKLEWTTETSLRIEFPINATAISPIKVSLKKSDASNTVSVSFGAHE